MKIKVEPVPEITAQQERFRMVHDRGMRTGRIERDPVEPVPVGTEIAMIFRVAGYDPDCDGSLMARLEHICSHGESSGFEISLIGLYPDGALVVKDRSEWK